MLNLLAQRYTPPFRHPLPGTMTAMLESEGLRGKLRENYKLLKRWLWLNLNGQSSLLRDQLPPAPARLLWLNFSNVSVGDSVMELAGRAMLVAYKVDLLIKGGQAELFSTDRYLNKVFTDPSALRLIPL